MPKRILFITKQSQGYHGTYSYNSSGLLNSAQFVVHMLINHGVEARLVTVHDNNDIDREVDVYRPDVAVIEALWVVPRKFEVLSQLYPDVTWIVRIHSDIPFLAQEGIAVQWIKEYSQHPSVFVGFNSHRALQSFVPIVSREKLIYLPNYFPLENREYDGYKDRRHLNVGCFGAIRPLKNQLVQAMAAIKYAENQGSTLHFHINSTRVEGGAEVLKNLRALFFCSGHRLVEHVWHSHRAFQCVLERMDVAMCVSLSETFCIVAADAVSLGVPLVCSSEVPWASKGSVVDATDVKDIVDGIDRALYWKSFHKYMNKRGLREYDERSVEVWKRFFEA